MNNIENKVVEAKKFPRFTYQKTAFSCDRGFLAEYLKLHNGVPAIKQKGVDNPYATIDKANKTIVFNSQIEKDTFGVAAEAARIKVCAVLNCAIMVFEAQGWTIESAELGVIECKKSALDDRNGKAEDLLTGLLD